MKKLSVLCLILLCVFSMTFSAAAAGMEDYTIDDGQKIAIPDAYTYSYTINTVVNEAGERSILGQPSDLFLDKNGYLYVVDSLNNRVVKITTEGKLIKEYTEAGDIPFFNPQGVYVEENGDLYISDTDNGRIVHLTADGKLVKEYGLPDSPMLSEVTSYAPTKIGMTEAGALYVLMGENIMRLDRSNTFRGYVGQADVGFDFLDALLRLVASEEQKKSIEKRTAAPYDNFCLDDQGLIYAVSRDTKEGQLKILNTVGNNIYRKVGSATSDWQAIQQMIGGFFSGNVISKAFTYGETAVVNGKTEQPQFTDICVDKNGIITVIQKNNSRLYQYDATGNLLAVFGGEGTLQGEFAIPISLVVDDDGRLYVLDQSYGTITVLEPTAFIETVQQATVAYDEGDYEEADKLWMEVLTVDETYPMAHFGAGRTAFKNGDWQEAMEYFAYASDRQEYSNAFAEQRYEIIKANFWLIALIVVVVVSILGVALALLIKYSKKLLVDFELRRIDRVGFGKGLLLGTNVLVRPSRTFEAIKYGRGRISTKAPLFILLVVFLVRLFFIFTVHYPFQDVQVDEANLVLEFIKLLLPVITWICVTYLISSQFEGESTFKENLTAVGFSMIPYIFVNLLAAGLSHVMCWNEKGFFAVMVNGVMLWYIFLFIRAVQRLNEYSFIRTVCVCLISLAGMVLCWFVALFAYSLVVCLAQFVQDIFLEIQLMI